MQIGQWQFRPRLIPAVITMLVLPLLISLGFWQLDRAEQKRALYRQFINHQEQEPVNLNEAKMLRTNKGEMMWRHVNLTGEYHADTHILLDNQSLDGKPGYLVFTPFSLSEENIVVLVNRGWIASSGDRSKVSGLDTPSHKIELSAVAKDVPVTGIVLGDLPVETVATGIYRSQRIHIDEIEKLVGYKLLPYIVRLEPESGYGFVRRWQLPGSGEEKHLGYAFQWFALAFTLVIIFIVVNTSRYPGHD